MRLPSKIDPDSALVIFRQTVGACQNHLHKQTGKQPIITIKDVEDFIESTKDKDWLARNSAIVSVYIGIVDKYSVENFESPEGKVKIMEIMNELADYIQKTRGSVGAV